MRLDLRVAAGQLTERLVADLGPALAAVVLYGSVARGEHRGGSDIDVLLLLAGERGYGGETILLRNRASRIRSAWELELGVVTSLLFTTEKESLKSLRVGDPFWREVMKDAVILYDSGAFKRVRDSFVAASR